MYKILQPAAVLGALLAAGAACGQVTESPVTVQPGRFLLEVDAISLTIDREPGLKYTAFGAASTFLTTGVTSRLDLQVGAEFYIAQKFDAAGFTERQSGVGDVYIRAKYRFYESNDTYTAAQCEQLCRAAGIQWREDPSNRDTTKRRARLRRDVLPVLEELWPGAAKRAAKCAMLLEQMKRRA